MILEVCVDSVESALIAEKSGADRLEICTALDLGGLTPSVGMVEFLNKEIRIPLHILIRPRPGNFTYSKSEIEVMVRDIQIYKKMGVSGFVLGVLNKKGHVDNETMSYLLSKTKDTTVTFHRAIDESKDLLKSIDDCKALGVNRILTSGGSDSAINGLKQLTLMNDYGSDDITIMPGSGINETNCKVFKDIGFKEIHGSFGKIDKKSSSHLFGQSNVCDGNKVKKVKSILNKKSQ